jgi:serine/threonine-protein kinase SRPK3
MIILKKLGEGNYTNVFLCKSVNDKFAAIKIPKSHIKQKNAIKWARNEVSLLEKFKNANHVISIIDYEINNDINYIMLELLGDELDSLVKHYHKYNKKLSIKSIKYLTKQILYGMQELSNQNILHNDLKIENILFTKTLNSIFKQSPKKLVKLIMKVNIVNQENEFLKKHIIKFCWILKEMHILNMHVKITDLGNSFSQELALSNKEEYDHSRPTRHYISPEILIRSPFWIESDMWSIGCIIFELITCNVIFYPYRDNSMGVNSMHLASMIKIFGPIPKTMIKLGKKSNHYFIKNKHKFQYLIKNESLFDLLHYYDISSNEIPKIIDFLTPIFEYDPIKRITPTKCLQSLWLI